jgi:RNA polymerase sigma factor (sigma-70 family)
MPAQSDAGRDPSDPGLSVLLSERTQLINLSYRLLGSLAEAEDAVQETYARWYALSRSQQDAIESPGAWLTRVASRICLNVLTSARHRRESSMGPWLPEPLPDPAEWSSGRPGADAADPADRVTLDESVSMAFLVMLESMTPAERVALILHDVFGYPFNEVAEITGRTPAACRQLASSGRRRVRVAQSPVTSPGQQASVVRDFKRAWEERDIGALIGVLDPGATLTGEGGAALQPIEGADQVAQFLVDIARGIPSGVTLLERRVNGQPGLIAQQDDRTLAVYAFEIASDQITRIWAMLNPDKLRHWST